MYICDIYTHMLISIMKELTHLKDKFVCMHNNKLNINTFFYNSSIINIIILAIQIKSGIYARFELG